MTSQRQMIQHEEFEVLFSLRHTGDDLDLGNTVRVTENDTNLRGRGTLSGELADLLDDLLGGGLQPGGSSARVGESGGRNALSLAVKSTHFGCAVVVVMKDEVDAVCQWCLSQVLKSRVELANFRLVRARGCDTHGTRE